MGQLVGLVIELPVGQMLLVKHHGDVVRCFFNLLFKQINHGEMLGKVGLRLVPDLELLLFHRRDHRQCADGMIGMRHKSAKQDFKVSCHALNRRRLKQIGRVFPRPDQTLLGFLENDGQIKQGRGVFPCKGAGDQAGQFEVFSRCILQGKRHLEQGMIAQRSRWLKIIDELFKRYVLMRVGIERHLPNPLEERREIGIAVQVGAEHQGVDKEANQRFKLLPVAIGNG